MLEILRQRIRQLIAAYEAEKMEGNRLRHELKESQALNETYRKQIIELERDIDNLKLTQAFTADGTDNTLAKKRIDKLMKEIDKCISLMEG